MADLIDRGALLNQFREASEEWTGYEVSIRIKAAPTVDAEVVRHDELERVKKELDAAKRDLAAISDKYMICFTCKYDHGGGISNCGKYGCSKTNMYEWRGPVAEDTSAPEVGAPGDEAMGGGGNG